MELTGEQDITASREVVWRALVDQDTLRACIPGCQEISGNVEDGFEATVVQKIGPVKATFRGTVTFEEVVAPDSLVMSGEGKGGAAGVAKGRARVELSDIEGGTRLTYRVTSEIGGKLARLGSRLLKGVSQKLADQLFVRFRDIVETDTPA
ncbi:MAG: carbon monoxide dehydrogenase subunit G [Rhodobacteraceae bacterium]|nr:carbon monoxide dehydrogenase subunit G [Paracoccaceae bacterium]MBR9823758.1 carbon monoxide dehydrogenase subunit G [Paracoccaceae bacterium]